MTRPISPKEVDKVRAQSIPNEVLEAFNELIAENWDGNSAHVDQAAAVRRIRAKLKASKQISEDKIFDSGWLDIESLYRAAGWKVKYDKPGYNESYDAFFVFTKR